MDSACRPVKVTPHSPPPCSPGKLSSPFPPPISLSPPLLPNLLFKGDAPGSPALILSPSPSALSHLAGHLPEGGAPSSPATDQTLRSLQSLSCYPCNASITSVLPDVRVRASECVYLCVHLSCTLLDGSICGPQTWHILSELGPEQMLCPHLEYLFVFLFPVARTVPGTWQNPDHADKCVTGPAPPGIVCLLFLHISHVCEDKWRDVKVFWGQRTEVPGAREGNRMVTTLGRRAISESVSIENTTEQW